MALAPHGQGRPRPWTPAGGGSAPRPLRSCEAEGQNGRGVGRSRDAKRERGASPRAANRSALETSLRLVSKRLLGYGGLWEGKRMEGRRGESEGKLENCSGSGRGCCGKRWAGMGQETEAVLGVLRRRMGREGTGDRNVPKGGGGVWRAGGPSAPRPCQTKAGAGGPSGPLPPLCARGARPPPPRGAAKNRLPVYSWAPQWPPQVWPWPWQSWSAPWAWS